MYSKFFKRLLDFLLCLIALILLSPIFIILIILGSIFMRGNPFFFQMRPGKNEKIFRLVKFRTMDNRKDKDGNLLPDEVRLNKYGRFLRASSLDEIPELFNIIKGDMAIVGPRPLLVQYLPLYSDEQRKRHSVRPGLTGWAQVNGRNGITWTQKFEYDIEYVNKITFGKDLKIIFKTIKAVFVHEGISSATSDTMEDFDGTN